MGNALLSCSAAWVASTAPGGAAADGEPGVPETIVAGNPEANGEGEPPSPPGAGMTSDLRVMLEPGPTDRRVVATAPDWPGLERAAKTEDEAIPRLLSCAPRCAAVARLAGMDPEFPVAAAADIVGRYPGAGSTDFWGISFAFSDLDRQPMPADDLERQLGLMWACRVLFEDARSRISAELRTGPRGGGRDRDQIDRHVIVSEHAPGEEARHACSDRTGAWRRRAARAPGSSSARRSGCTTRGERWPGPGRSGT